MIVVNSKFLSFSVHVILYSSYYGGLSREGVYEVYAFSSGDSALLGHSLGRSSRSDQLHSYSTLT